MKKAKMELVDRRFSQKIADRYTNLKLFTTDFTPIISTKRIIPRMKWLELVYALPYLVLRREILNSFRRTKNVFASVKQIWNILVQLEFPLGHYKYITTRLHRFSRESPGFYFESSSMELAHPVSYETTRIETESAFSNYRLPIVTQQPPVVSHKPSVVSYKNQIPPSTSDFTTPLFSYYSFKPTFFKSSSMELAHPVSRETTRIETEKESAFPSYQLPMVSHMPSTVRYDEDQGTYIPTSRSDFITPLFSYYSFKPTFFKSSSMELAQPVSRETTRIETEKESAVTNYQLPVATHQPPVVSHKPSAVRYEDLATYILTSRSDFITPLFSYYSTQKIKADMGEKAIYDILPYFNFMNKQSHLNISGVEKAPIYHTYPKIEHATSTHTEIIKERVIEKEDKTPHATPQLPSIDLNRLTDQIYQVIERKIRIERERRGLLCR